MKKLHLYAITVAILGSALFCFHASADNMSDDVLNTGNELTRYCNDENYTNYNANWNYCVGYVAGVDAGLNLATFVSKKKNENYTENNHRLKGYCLPPNVVRDQMGKVVAKYLHDHPEDLNFPDATLIMKAFRSAWPCSG